MASSMVSRPMMLSSVARRVADLPVSDTAIGLAVAELEGPACDGIVVGSREIFVALKGIVACTCGSGDRRPSCCCRGLRRELGPRCRS